MDSLKPSSEDDIFHSAVCIEQDHYKEGYNQGYADGLASGDAKEDGRQVGLRSGFEVGEELDFYRGVIDVWNSAILVEPTCFSSRVIKSIKQMEELLNKYPMSHPEDESVTDLKDSLRLKFRAICASLHLNLEYIGYPKLLLMVERLIFERDITSVLLEVEEHIASLQDYMKKVFVAGFQMPNMLPAAGNLWTPQFPPQYMPISQCIQVLAWVWGCSMSLQPMFQMCCHLAFLVLLNLL